MAGRGTNGKNIVTLCNVFHGLIYLVSAVTSVGTAMGLSLYSNTTLEDVARESPNTVKFIQMQLYTDRQFMETILKRSEKAGYRASFINS